MLVRTIALLGHKDHGKSTLIGNMLIQTGSATQVRINEAKVYSEKMHKPFEPAFILDSFAEEREQEMTYDTTRAEIKHKDLAFAFIDVPGHEELIKNMISGASYGEIAILLVSAKGDEGVRDQTRRHLFISRMLGIERLIVAVNKMDTIQYDEGRFEEIKSSLGGFIGKIGFNPKNVCFVPISAYNGENLVKRSKKMGWYGGDALIDAIYKNAKRAGGRKRGPLRIIVQGVLDQASNMIGGRIVSGRLAAGNRIVIMPCMDNAVAREIIVKGKRVRNANVGENVAIRLDRKVKHALRGAVISGLSDRPLLTDTVNARIFVTKRFGKDVQIKFNGIDIRCSGIKVLNGIDTTTGEKIKATKPEILNAIDAQVRFERRLPVERFEETKELGRFVLYSKKDFAGIGTIK